MPLFLWNLYNNEKIVILRVREGGEFVGIYIYVYIYEWLCGRAFVMAVVVNAASPSAWLICSPFRIGYNMG